MSNPTSDVTQLILRERQCHDCGWYDQMRECFTIDLAIDDRTRYMSESRDRSAHRLSPLAVAASCTTKLTQERKVQHESSI